jgi:hypothetical protein
MTKKPYPVYIEWVDTIGDPDGGWKDTEGTDDFFERNDNIVRELGFVWDEDDDFICLISKWMPSDDIPITAGRTKIPKKWIIKRQSLRIKDNSGNTE